MFAAMLLAVLGWIEVGSPGNPPFANTRGTVDYTYAVADRPVTTREMTDFLNQTRIPFPFPRYDVVSFGFDGENYVPDDGIGDGPVIGVDWITAARYVNYLASGGTSTESGAYELVGSPVVQYTGSEMFPLMMTPVTPAAMVRTPGAAYFLPTVDEWYKAAPLVSDSLTHPKKEMGQLTWVGEYCVGKTCYGPSAMAGAYNADGGGALMTSSGSAANVGFRVYRAVPDGPVTLLGDFDVDADLDSADLLGMLSDWTGAQEPMPVWTSRSDINRDGDVDSDDLLGLLAGWTGAEAAGRAAVVPEPSGWVLMVVGVVMLRRVRER